MTDARHSLCAARKGDAEDGYRFKVWKTGRTWACHATSPFEWLRTFGFLSKEDADAWGEDALGEFQRNDALYGRSDD